MSYMYRSKPEIFRFQLIPPFIFPLQSLLSALMGIFESRELIFKFQHLFIIIIYNSIILISFDKLIDLLLTFIILWNDLSNFGFHFKSAKAWIIKITEFLITLLKSFHIYLQAVLEKRTWDVVYKKTKFWSQTLIF